MKNLLVMSLIPEMWTMMICQCLRAIVQKSGAAAKEQFFTDEAEKAPKKAAC